MLFGFACFVIVSVLLWFAVAGGGGGRPEP